jgi:hypothetical protein
MARPTARSLGVLVFVIGAAVGLVTASSGGNTIPPPAGPGEDTYTLSDLAIEYPYLDSSAGEGKLDPTRAGIAWTATTATSRTPGKVTCSLTLRDARGDVVGSGTFELTIIGTSGQSHHPTPVSVSAEPSDAKGHCTAPAAEPPVKIDELAITARDGRESPVLVGDVSWAGIGFPSEQFCTATFSDGSQTREITLTFDPDPGIGTDISLIPRRLVGYEPTSIHCQQLAGTELDQLAG